jgi:F0F1-type ATP synthase membrane subunit b/b'
MIEDAKQYAGYRMARAKKKFSDEMVDLAIEIVKERLIENISDEDEQKLTTQFISNLDTAKKHVS